MAGIHVILNCVHVYHPCHLCSYLSWHKYNAWRRFMTTISWFLFQLCKLYINAGSWNSYLKNKFLVSLSELFLFLAHLSLNLPLLPHKLKSRCISLITAQFNPPLGKWEVAEVLPLLGSVNAVPSSSGESAISWLPAQAALSKLDLGLSRIGASNWLIVGSGPQKALGLELDLGLSRLGLTITWILSLPVGLQAPGC